MALKPGKYDSMKPDIELFDFKSKKRYGLKLDGNGLQIGTISQDDSVLVRNAGKRVGDFDEQRSWKGGRAVENLSDNAEGFYDSMNAWTLSDNRVHQTLLWQFARGLRSCDYFMPDSTHSMSWKALVGESLYLDMSWTSMGFAADFARMWVRRVGTPGTLTFKLYSGLPGSSGSLLQTVTKTVSDVTDYVSVLLKFDWTGTETLNNVTTYHIVVSGASTDTKNNHWEIGGYSGGLTGQYSSDNAGWYSASFDPYYYVATADTNRTFFSLFLDGAMYVVSRNDDGTASKLYINGDRGKATSATSTTIVDTTRSFTVNQYAGAYVKIIRGTGIGQIRQIASNTTTGLTVSTWDITPSTDSEFIIYGTPWFRELTGTGLTVVSGQPVVANQIVYFPQGSGTNIRWMVWTGTGHAFGDDGTNKADFLTTAQNNNVAYVCKALKVASTIAFAPVTAWAASPTTLVYSTTPKVIGTTSYPITGINTKESLVYVFKEDGVWNIDSSLNTLTLNSGLEKTASQYNGLASLVHQQFIYYSWLHSLIRIYGTSHDDIGQDWSGKGLPEGREGNVSCIDSYTSLLIVSIDAGTGTSSVLGFDGIAWHELLRAYDSAERIRFIKIQTNAGTRNRLWTDVGGDLVFQELPLMKGAPRLDSGCRYQHEAVIESSAIDMGTASGLPKFIKELTVFCENVGNGNEIVVDYQTDDNVGTTNWTEATTLYESPESVAFLGLDNVRKFSYRLRIRSSDNTDPVVVRGVTPNGYARAPYKMVWTLRCRADNITSSGRLVKPPELMRWLLDNARYPGRIMMLSQYELAHKFFVIVHPPRMFPYKPAAAGQTEESMFTIVLEEA